MNILISIAIFYFSGCVSTLLLMMLSNFPTDSRLQIESIGELPYDNIHRNQKPIYYILKDTKSGNEFLYIKTYHSGVITEINLDKQETSDTLNP